MLIENAIGRNLAGNFPTIDRWANGIATSIKSLNLGAATYQNLATLTRTVRGYIDSAARFDGAKWAGVTISQSSIVGRALELAIPAGAASQAQLAALQALVGYGQGVGVTVTIIPL